MHAAAAVAAQGKVAYPADCDERLGKRLYGHLIGSAAVQQQAARRAHRLIIEISTEQRLRAVRIGARRRAAGAGEGDGEIGRQRRARGQRCSLPILPGGFQPQQAGRFRGGCDSGRERLRRGERGRRRQRGRGRRRRRRRDRQRDGFRLQDAAVHDQIGRRGNGQAEQSQEEDSEQQQTAHSRRIKQRMAIKAASHSGSCSFSIQSPSCGMCSHRLPRMSPCCGVQGSILSLLSPWRM